MSMLEKEKHRFSSVMKYLNLTTITVALFIAWTVAVTIYVGQDSDGLSDASAHTMINEAFDQQVDTGDPESSGPLRRQPTSLGAAYVECLHEHYGAPLMDQVHDMRHNTPSGGSAAKRTSCATPERSTASLRKK